jgi:hypothetical protein
MGEKSILLTFVESVNLVDKENGRFGALLLKRFGLLDYVANFFDSRKHGGKKDKLRGNSLGKDGRQSCFPRAGRPPKNQGGDGAPFDQLPEKFSLANKVFLTDEIFKTSRTHSLGEGAMSWHFFRHGQLYSSVLEMDRDVGVLPSFPAYPLPCRFHNGNM